MSEEEKAIKWLGEKTIDYRLNSEDLHYFIILKQLIKNIKVQLQQKDNIIKEIKSQLDYLETYSSKEDVFEDMKRRLNNIEKIIGGD